MDSLATSSGELFTRTKVHPVVPPPLKLVRMLLCLSTLAISRSAATSVCSFIHRSWLQNIKTDTRALSWYKLVTYLGVGRCVIYTASGPLALGCVNLAASYTSVCNLYVDALHCTSIYTCTYVTVYAKIVHKSANRTESSGEAAFFWS